MAMVSEFLGQLCLNAAVIALPFPHSPTPRFAISRNRPLKHFHFSANPQSFDPKYPTVMPALDFDPDKDAARIETAIKTKGELHWVNILGCGASLRR